MLDDAFFFTPSNLQGKGGVLAWELHGVGSEEGRWSPVLLGCLKQFQERNLIGGARRKQYRGYLITTEWYLSWKSYAWCLSLGVLNFLLTDFQKHLIIWEPGKEKGMPSDLCLTRHLNHVLSTMFSNYNHRVGDSLVSFSGRTHVH